MVSAELTRKPTEQEAVLRVRALVKHFPLRQGIFRPLMIDCQRDHICQRAHNL
jgi:hypothetical protein